ncbi:hypothetical protein [Sphaerisporangium rhizosphaerae]|uniref:DNA-binding protein n=1 Tax=Sphaerisporangium rhizosphaerae TaxID=2269375 RepID=A0ABW2NZ94_9ACTN
MAAVDPLWDVKQIADFLGKGEQWVYRSAREYGLDLFDIGGNNLRSPRSEVLRFAFRNSADPLRHIKAYLDKERSKRR